MAEVVRAALVGAGVVGQVAHLQTLTSVSSPIRLAAIVDASPARAATLGAAHRVPHATDLAHLDADVTASLDAVVISAPDPVHHDLAITALGMGLHVFIEKPLALTPAEGTAMQAAAQASGRVCQVGYMKRFDPAPNALLDDLRRRDARITGIAVEVRDPDAAPFVRDFPFIPATDVPASIVEQGSRRFAAAVAEVLGRLPEPADATAYASYISALVHDLNLVRMLVPEPMHVEAGFTAMGGLQVGMHLRTPSGCLIRMTHTQDPSIADYEERFVVYTTRGVYEMVFPAPYLLYATTTLRRIDVKDAAERSEISVLNDSTEEAFVLELHAFADAIIAGRATPVANSFAEAVEDLRLLGEAFRMSRRG